MKRFVVGSAILGITLLNFFQFPGHTWLQSDTQIYAPILEHMRDRSVLGKDILLYVVLLHTAGALIQHFVLKTGVLRRMLAFGQA